MRETMYSYWRKQPEVMQSIIAGRKAITENFVSLYTEQDPDRIYLIGSGTSLNSLLAAAPFMEHVLGIEVTPTAASMAVDMDIFGKRPIFIFVSQGGFSTNTLWAMEHLSRYPHIAITGDSESQLEKQSRRHMLIGCGEEQAGPKTVGYTSTILCLYLCALESALRTGKIHETRYDKLLSDLSLAADNMAENRKSVEAWFEKNMKDFESIDKYVLVGKGPGGITAKEGALKILETVRVPAMSYEFEEYLHGPIQMMDEDVAAIFYLTEDAADKERMLTLAKWHRKYSAYGYVITGDTTIMGDHVLHVLKTGNPFTEVFEFILLPQLIGARIPGLVRLNKLDTRKVLQPMFEEMPVKYRPGK